MNQDVEEILKCRNIQPTAVRILVLRAMWSQYRAMSLHELETELATVERTTLYRTLKTFVKSNLIHEIEDGSGSTRFALCAHNCTCSFQDLHLHFYCTHCKKTQCMPDTPIPQVSLPQGFVLETANFVVKGICADCKK